MTAFLTFTKTAPPQISALAYLGMLVCLVLLTYLSWRFKDKLLWRRTFWCLQALQLLALYSWYIWQGFPLTNSLPLFHCRLAMFALLFLREGRLKTYFALLGVVGAYCAIIYPVLDPYDFPHITGFSFLIGHYALLVNGLLTLFASYERTALKSRQVLVATFVFNFLLVLVNQWTGGNYGLLRNTPFIMETPLWVRYLAVSIILSVLMLALKWICDKWLLTKDTADCSTHV